MDGCNQAEKSYLRALLNVYIKKKVDVFFHAYVGVCVCVCVCVCVYVCACVCVCVCMCA